MHYAVLVLALAACDRGERAPKATTATRTTTATTPSNHAPTKANGPARMPAGWVAIDPPSEGRLSCANYSDDEWQVSVEGDDLRIIKAVQREPDTGPAVTFKPTDLPEPGRRHAVAVPDGFLLGFDGGEWGGALFWVSADGAKHTEIAKENVHAVFALGDNTAIALEGLAHLSLDEGAVRWLERSANGWTTKRVDKLDGEPQASVAAPDAIYAVTLDSLVRIKRDGKVERVQPLATPALYPDSMAVDAAGQLWLGMRQLVLRLTPDGDHYKPQWFVEERCRNATKVDLTCRCAP